MPTSLVKTNKNPSLLFMGEERDYVKLCFTPR
jgi:hypothetical protein